MSANPGDVLMGAGRPVLVVPPGVEHVSARRVAVAWKNTLQTRRAISDALPFLKMAEAVQVIRITDNPDQAEVEDVAGFLALHGVNATSIHRPADGATVAASLEEAVAAFGSDLIVSGAFG
jgi:nucleotide-binding universal stress UspA family protein